MRNPEGLITLHPKAKIISFEHKFDIQNIFNKSMLGNLGIHYFSLMIVDPNNVLSIYSTNPALEHNIIHRNLWTYDGIFEAKNHKDDAFYFWDELYATCLQDTLQNEKERRFGFSFGFSIVYQINDLVVIYSFAAKDQKREGYLHSKYIFSKIGDYFFSELKSIYQRYVYPKAIKTNQGKLKLVVNNTKRYVFL